VKEVLSMPIFSRPELSMGIAHDDETVFNESCGHSWKLTGYGTSFIEVLCSRKKGLRN